MGWVSVVRSAGASNLLAMPDGAKPVAILCLGHVESFYDKPMLDNRAGATRQNLKEHWCSEIAGAKRLSQTIDQNGRVLAIWDERKAFSYFGPASECKLLKPKKSRSTVFQRPKPRNHRLARSQRPRQAHHQLQTPRLALQPAALLGRAVPDCCLEARASGHLYHGRCRRSALPVLPPPLTDYKPTATGEPLARMKDWVQLPDGSTRETNFHASMGRLMLVLSPVSRY